MKKSMEKISSDKSTSELETLFSFKRYYINNLDSYHGEYILKEVSKVLEKNAAISTRDTSQTVVGEDMEPAIPQPPEQLYEIIGTVSDTKIKSLDNVARIVPKSECLPQMLTSGTVILDISYNRDELAIAMDYMKLLKDLLEKQTPAVAGGHASDIDDGGGESKKRYLILISTVMTWASTKPLDPQRIYDLMILNLNMEPTFIVETMALQWTSELTFAENVPALMKQFKKERGLKPFKVVVYGPPIVGKTTLSKLLCEAYGLVYISPETVAQDMLEDLAWRVSHWEVGEVAALAMPTGEEVDPAATDIDDDQGEEEGIQEAARNTLAVLRSGRPLTDEDVMGYLRQRLLCREAQNRGWVLDGFPTTLAQCAALFEKGEEHDSDVEEENEEEQFDEDLDLFSNVLKKLLPDIVVSLEASDDFICEKAMRQPEGDSRLDEETVLKRLSEFRTGDSRDVSPLNFFDELDIHPLVVPVDKHTDYGMKGSYAAVALRMGRPCRYGKLLALIEAAEKQEKAEHETLRAKEAKAMKDLEQKMKEEREEKMEYWSELYALMREEEEAALAAAGEPMRNYLVHHIFPTLTPALLEVAKLRPEDPIDFLAEFLFKMNPSGKMLEPGYNLQAEKLLGKIKILDDALKDLDIKIDPLVPPEAEVGESSSKKNINSMSAF